MSKVKIELLSNLLRSMESEIGTRDVAELVFESISDAVGSFRCCEGVEEFCEQFNELVDVVSNTEPKFGILNYHLANLQEDFEQSFCHKNFSEKRWKSSAKKKIRKIIKAEKKRRDQLLQNADQLDVEGKLIMIHDQSHTVQDVLVHYKNMGKKFRVVIAEQDYDKTHSNIERMHSARIPFQVVPSYMLSHVLDEIDMIFFGGLTLKDNMDIVMSPGAHGIISEFHPEKTQIYLFMQTSKFSLWRSKRKSNVFIHRHTREHPAKRIQYERIKYSHDRVQADLFTKIVTEEGLFTAKQLEKLYNKRLEKYLAQRKKSKSK